MLPHDGALVTTITWVRVKSRDETRVIRLTTIRHDDQTEEIRLDGKVIGFVHRAGLIFVALIGSRLDRALECAQSVMWDGAAAELIIESGGFPDAQASRFRGAEPNLANRYRIRSISPAIARQNSRRREKSR